MIYLLFQLAIWLIVALLIGLFVGWWIWARRLQLTMTRHEALETEHTTQANRLLAFEGDLDKAKDDARSHQAEATDLQKQLERAKQELSQSKEDAGDLADQLKDRDKTIVKLQAQLDNKAQLLDTSKQDLEAARDQHKDALATTEDLSAKLAKLEGQHETLEKQYAAQSHDLEAVRKKLANSERASSGALAEVALLGTTLATLNEERATIDARVVTLQEDLQDMNQRRSSAEQRAQDLEGQLNDTRADLDAQRQECAGHKSDLTTLLTDLATLQGQHEQLSERAQTQTRALLDQQAKLDTQRHQTVEAQTMVSQLQEQMVMLHAQLEELEMFKRQLAEQRARYDELSQASQTQKQLLDKTQLHLTTSQKETAKAEAEAVLLRTTVSELKQEQEGLVKANAELDEARAQSNVLVIELQQQQAASNYALAELREQFEYWRAMAKSLQQQLDESQDVIQRQDLRYNSVIKHNEASFELLNMMQQHSETLLGKQNQTLESGTTYHKTQMARLDELFKDQPDGAPQWFVAYIKQAETQRVNADELARVQAELTRLEILYAQAQAQLERFAQTEQDAKAQSDKINTLAKQLNEAKRALEASQAKLKTTHAALELAQQSNSTFETQLQASVAEMDLLSQQHELALKQAKEDIQYVEVPCAVCAAQLELPNTPAAEWTPPPVLAASVKADELQRIKGIGPVLETTLHDLGYRTFAQLAKWDEQDVAYVAKQLNCFPDRIVRDDWVNQAAEFATEGNRASA